MNNTFSPTFGYRPQYFINREKEASDFVESLAGAPGHPQRTTFFIGQRGMGKTVLLLELARRAGDVGFIAVRVTAGEKMLEEIIEGIQIAGDSRTKSRKNPVKSISAGAFGFSVGLSFTDEVQKNYGFRTKLSLLCEAMAKQKKGVLFLIDELYAGTPEMREFATTYQHLVGDGMNIAVAMAGLPNAISSILNDKILTFLNRSHKVHLQMLPIADVSACFIKALGDMNAGFDAAAINAAAKATEGYPYLFQLVGYNIQKLLKAGDVLTTAIVDVAVTNSINMLVSDVFAPCLNPLSPQDRKFLRAMAADPDTSLVSELRERLAVDKSYIQTYRKRLIDAGVIHSPSRGCLSFSIPYMGRYLRGELDKPQ